MDQASGNTYFRNQKLNLKEKCTPAIPFKGEPVVCVFLRNFHVRTIMDLLNYSLWI